MKKSFLVGIVLLITAVSSQNTYKKLYKWAMKNGIEISDKLKMNWTSENNRYFYAKEDIDNQEVLITIPASAMLSTNKTLELFSKNKKIKKLYNEVFNRTEYLSQDILNFRKDGTFLAGVLYLVNHYKKYDNSKFVKVFKDYYDSLESSVETFPFFYTFNQRIFLLNTSFAPVLDLVDQFFNEDTLIFEKGVGHSIEKDEFLRYRMLMSGKGINITGSQHIVPFIDMFKRNPVTANLNMTYNDTEKVVKIISSRDIKKKEELVFSSPYLTNINSLILYGETYEELKDFVQMYTLPLIDGEYLKKIGLKPEDYDLNKKIEMNEEKFFKKALKFYKDLSKKKGGDGSAISAYKMFVEYLELRLKTMEENMNPSNIYKLFVGQRNIDNVKRIVKSDIDFLKTRIAEVQEAIERLEKKEAKRIQDEKEGKVPPPKKPKRKKMRDEPYMEPLRVPKTEEDKKKDEDPHDPHRHDHDRRHHDDPDRERRDRERRERDRRRREERDKDRDKERDRIKKEIEERKRKKKEEKEKEKKDKDKDKDRDRKKKNEEL